MRQEAPLVVLNSDLLVVVHMVAGGDRRAMCIAVEAEVRQSVAPANVTSSMRTVSFSNTCTFVPAAAA